MNSIIQRFMLTLLVLPAWLSGTVTGQHFLFEPVTHLEKTVSAFEYSNHIIFMKNLTGGELILGWERLEMDMPDTWSADLCDYIGCYMGVPESGTMMPVSDTTRGYLKVTINPNDTPGTATFAFRVFDNKHPEISDTCSFTIHATEITGIARQKEPFQMSIYPIPAHDFIHVDYKREIFSGTLSVIDGLGRVIITQALQGERNSKINSQHLEDGMYVIQLTNKQGLIERKAILVK